MVNVMKCYISMLHKLMKSIGMHSIDVEIEPGTVIHFWVNINKEKNNKNKEGNEKKKPALVLIQGFAGTGILTWQFQVLALRKKYTLYIPDLIFFGGSYTNKTDRTPRFQADCFAIGLKKLGVKEKCVVVGFSYGGFVGFQMAEHHPDLVGLLVVAGSVLAVSESIYKDTLKRIGFSNFVDFLLPTTVEGVKVLLKIGSYKFPWMPDLFRKHFLETMFSNRKEKAELLDDALVVKDEEVTKHQFQQSIHLLWGNDDKIFDLEVAKNLKEKLGENAELQVIKNAGHLVVQERPFAFNKRLKKIILEYSHSLAIANKNISS